jgi:glutaredoxin 3
MKDVTVYTTNWCPYCRQAEKFLTDKKVAFKNVDVTDNDELRTQLVEMSGGRKTVPQIFVGDQPIGGFTDMMALHKDGKLAHLLGIEAL